MTATSPATAPQAVAKADNLEKPQTKRFRKRYDTVRLPAEAAVRQGKAATAAFLALKDREAMLAFLNTHDDVLGGRPIDLAVASDAGLASVQQALVARAVA